MAEIPRTLSAETDLPPPRHFEIQAVFSEEHKNLATWLEEEANQALSSPDATAESASARVEQLVGKITLDYCKKVEVNPQLLARAQDGTLQNYVPSRSSILAYNVLRWIAIGAEVSLAVVFMLLGQATAVFVLVALMLALGGFLLGNGVGGLFERAWLQALPRELSAPKTRGIGLDLAKTIGGVVMVLGISYLRSLDEEGTAVIFVVGVPLLLALLITLFEALHFMVAAKYQFLRRQMSHAQRWYAIENHREALQTYRQYYQGKVKEITLQMHRAVKAG